MYSDTVCITLTGPCPSYSGGPRAKHLTPGGILQEQSRDNPLLYCITAYHQCKILKML